LRLSRSCNVIVLQGGHCPAFSWLRPMIMVVSAHPATNEINLARARSAPTETALITTIVKGFYLCVLCAFAREQMIKSRQDARHAKENIL
jgi:hypothetical protein